MPFHSYPPPWRREVQYGHNSDYPEDDLVKIVDRDGFEIVSNDDGEDLVNIIWSLYNVLAPEQIESLS